MKKNYIKPQGIITSLRPEERFAGGSFSIQGSSQGFAQDVLRVFLSSIGLGDSTGSY